MRASAWYHAALDSLEAAGQLADARPRSSISRAYYSAYAACCAWFEQLGFDQESTPDGNSTWYSHGSVCRYLEEAAGDGGSLGLPVGTSVGSAAEVMANLRMLRVDADYDAEAILRANDARSAVGMASAIVALVTEACGWEATDE